MVNVTATSMQHRQLLDRAVEHLRSVLPPSWLVKATADKVPGDERADLVIELRDTAGNTGYLAVEAKRGLTPREVQDRVAFDIAGRPGVPIIVAPWLSRRTRQVLDERDASYLDLTGNVSVRLDQPAAFIRLQGADRDPQPAARSPLTLRGPQAGRLVRALVDIVPPYSPTQLATAAGISLSYASRQLTELDREALVERGRRGQVVARDWAGLLRRRAEFYGVFTTNAARGFIAPTGPRALLKKIDASPEPIKALTGSFAAAEIAPVAAPGQLLLYVDDPDETATRLGLLPSDRGADVVLLEPYDPVVFERVRGDTGVRRVAESQLVLDCLGGNGRMPAEGEALLDWMADTTGWQVAGIDLVGPRGESG